jgi:hypothetical protein
MARLRLSTQLKVERAAADRLAMAKSRGDHSNKKNR